MNYKVKIQNTITIDLVVTANLEYNQKVNLFEKIELRIDGKLPYGEGIIIDFPLILKSLKEDGNYILFNCSCGIAECAGIYDGIQVTNSTDEVEWIDLDSGTRWVFLRKSIEKQIKTIKRESLRYRSFFKKKEIEYVSL